MDLEFKSSLEHGGKGGGKEGKKKREGNVAGTKAVLGNKTCTHMSCKNMNIDI